MMAYFTFLISGVFHGLAMLFAGTLGMNVKSDKDTARIALWMSFAMFIFGVMASVIAGFLMFGEGV